MIQAKCPNCGGDIEIDGQRKSGFCLYCGSKVMFKKAEQSTESPDNVIVKGIAPLDKLLKNAETFHNLGDYEKEAEVLTSITKNYPEDYRGWWGLALQDIEAPYDRDENEYGELEPYRFSDSYKKAVSLLKRTLFYVRHAVQLAPEGEKQTIMQKTKEWYEGYLLFFQGEKQKWATLPECLKEAKAVRRRAKIHHILSGITLWIAKITLIIGLFSGAIMCVDNVDGWPWLPITGAVIGGTYFAIRWHREEKGWHDDEWYEEREWAKSPFKEHFGLHDDEGKNIDYIDKAIEQVTDLIAEFSA